MTKIIGIILMALSLGSCSEVQKAMERQAKTPVDQCPEGAPVYRCQGPCTAPVAVRRPGYWLAYSPDYRQPLWVCETVEPYELKGPATRAANFPLDPQVPKAYQTASTVYSKSGYDLGHMAPAANQNSSQQAQQDTFYISNISPQLPAFNRGVWVGLETWIRDWVTKHNQMVWVISGPIFRPGLTKKVGLPMVPSHFYKILVTKDAKGNYVTLSVILEHREYPKPYRWKTTSIDAVEEMTGLDFLPNLPEGKAHALEAPLPSQSAWQ